MDDKYSIDRLQRLIDLLFDILEGRNTKSEFVKKILERFENFKESGFDNLKLNVIKGEYNGTLQQIIDIL